MQSTFFQGRALALASAITCALVGMTSTAQAAPSDADLQRLQQEIRAMRDQYESRLKSLEQQLQDAMAAKSSAAAASASPAVSTASAAPRPRSQDASFNPAVSLILSGTYAHLQRDPESWSLGQFLPGGEELGPGDKGINLGESEISFRANIDPYWYGSLTLALTPDNEAEVEEAFVQTTALSNGVTAKFGRYLSGVGYLNEQHAHTWDFVDAPLGYQAFLGGQLKQDGAQVKWLLPTDQFAELGAEVARGAGQGNGAGSSALFARTGGDVGTSHNWRVGVSHLWEQNLDRSWTAYNPLNDADAENQFTGKGRLWVVDGVWKWAPNGNAKSTNFKLQGEYFRRQAQGQVLADVGGAEQLDGFKSAASGWYVQGVYQFTPGWRTGLRHEQLNPGNATLGLNSDLIRWNDHKPQRSSVMLDWALSEFSRWRVQFNSDRTRADQRDNQVFLQYQMSLGAHGAHSY